MKRVRQFLFKWRGGLVAPVALVFIYVAQPTIQSLMAGAILAFLGNVKARRLKDDSLGPDGVVMLVDQLLLVDRLSRDPALA